MPPSILLLLCEIIATGTCLPSRCLVKIRGITHTDRLMRRLMRRDTQTQEQQGDLINEPSLFQKKKRVLLERGVENGDIAHIDIEGQY